MLVVILRRSWLNICIMAAKPKQKSKKRTPKSPSETDGAYFLKLVLFLLLSSLWVRLEFSDGSVIPLPVGAVIAVIYALHDHFQIDRKIELALILVGMFISFWLPIGIFISL